MFFPIDLRCVFVYHPTGHGWQELIQFHEAFYVIETKQLEAVKCEEMGAVQRTEATNDNYKQTMLKMGIKIIAISHQLYLCCGWVLTKGWIGSEFWPYCEIMAGVVVWTWPGWFIKAFPCAFPSHWEWGWGRPCHKGEGEGHCMANCYIIWTDSNFNLCMENLQIHLGWWTRTRKLNGYNKRSFD